MPIPLRGVGMFSDETKELREVMLTPKNVSMATDNMTYWKR